MMTGILRTISASWTRRAAPQIVTQTPAHVTRAMRCALRAVDREIELTGAVSAETVDRVRAALALDRSPTLREKTC